MTRALCWKAGPSSTVVQVASRRFRRSYTTDIEQQWRHVRLHNEYINEIKKKLNPQIEMRS